MNWWERCIALGGLFVLTLFAVENVARGGMPFTHSIHPTIPYALLIINVIGPLHAILRK